MRRQRTLIDWALFAALAFLGLLTATTALTLLENGNLHRTIDQLEEQRRELESTRTGGAEIIVPEFVLEMSWVFPLAETDYRVFTSPFGFRRSPLLQVEMFHTGLDIAGVWRSQIIAVADGVVIEHWPPPGTPYPGGGTYRGEPTHGGYIVIEHADGIRTGYSHLSSTRIHTGDTVRAGQVIGRQGNTGQSDGEHLHFSVILPDGTLANPLLYVQEP